MLDIVEVTAPTATGLDIVSVADLKTHLRITNSSMDTEIGDAIKEAADGLHGLTGILNRTVFPCRWVRYLRAFPTSGIIRLPFPPLKEVISIAYEDGTGSSPAPVVDPTTYIVRLGAPIGEIELKSGESWPSADTHPRAVAVTFDAGYDTYPPNLKRLLKILASDYIENKEASINDRVAAMTNRKTSYGVDYLLPLLRIPVSYDGWE
jgi:uncharacterized phiE125 gp8 family phage protein